ncbi:bile acid:sodium symporter family protein [Anaeroselena agilis]|uniref:Bile acid:sodium symporter family protein n=1 Tax=Anaeroselena agilis TaxID=3063788 RepID=A0ABU3P2Z7_9FIRM|nr:bile acid:sodium symporter family protein [Selenomonadales bacterium 4137-cl]
MQKLNKWLDSHMFLLVLVALAIGFFVRLPDSPALKKVIVYLFAYMTFATSITTSLGKFGRSLLKPWIPLWSLALIHIVTPAIVWGISAVIYPAETEVRLGYLVAAAIPIGVTSVVWTAMTKGDLNLSLAAVTLDAVATPVILPLYFNVVIGQLVAINYWNLVIQLMLMVTLPSIIGMAIYDFTRGRSAPLGEGIGATLSKLAFFIVILINSSVISPQLSWNLALFKMAVVTFLMSLTGYAAGYLGAFILRDRTPGMTLTMIYNVGLRNISFGLVIALTYFPPASAIPIMLLILYQQPLAAVIPKVLQRWDPRFRGKTA